MRLYRYIGPRHIAERVSASPTGTAIASPQQVARWAQLTGQQSDAEGRLVATFVVDAAGALRVADRRSEHVACAGGGPVQSAGEITFTLGHDPVGVDAVSNQSTGYCPEPESWSAVEESLRRAGFEPPAGFSPACVFRRCPGCGSICLVKGGWFECGVCGSELPPAYNCQGE